MRENGVVDEMVKLINYFWSSILAKPLCLLTLLRADAAGSCRLADHHTHTLDVFIPKHTQGTYRYLNLMAKGCDTIAPVVNDRG